MPVIPVDDQDAAKKQGQQGVRATPGRLAPFNSTTAPTANASTHTKSRRNTVAASSDDDELAMQADEEDAAGDMVGVSMSRAQSRMKARSTPAEEKNRIMERNGGYFETIPDMDNSDGLYLSDRTESPAPVPAARGPLPQQQQQQQQLSASSPSPPQEPTAESKEAATTEDRPNKDVRSRVTRSILNGLPKRPRALSGDLSLKKFLPDLGSLARRSSLSFRANNASSSSQNQSSHVRSQTLPKPPPTSELSPEKRLSEVPTLSLPRRKSMPQVDSSADAEEPISELQSLGGSTAAKHSFSRRPSGTGAPGAPPLLRRTSSDHSLYLRASSTASSLDNRPQYEHIHSQVNSRFKAIKDSLQDSSSRLLSMPAFNLQDIRADWGYKPFFNDVAQRKSNNEGDDESSSQDEQQQQQQQQQSARPNPGSITHPVLTEAMGELKGDVVIMGGYRGSILRSAKPPHRQLWVPMKVGLNLRKVDLEVGLNPEDEENMPDHVIPSGVLSHIGPVDICRRLMKRLQKCDNALNGDLRVWDYGYDWRLSPHLLSKKLVEYLQGLPCNSPDVPREKRGAYVIAHSLGGLITRHAVNQRPDLFAGVVYAGVPQHCVNILGPLRNGDDVLLSSRVLTAQVNFSFRTSFALLPEDGHCFIDKQSKEEFPVDFFSPDTWREYRLSPCISTALPPVTNRTFLDNLPLLTKKLNVLGNMDDNNNTGNAPEQHINRSETSPAILRSQQQDEELSSPDRAQTTAETAENDFAVQQPPHHEPSHKQMKSPAAAAGGIVGPTTHPRGAAGAPKTAATANIPYDKAMEYLGRTLAEVRRFKEELYFNPAHQEENHYPPFAVAFGKSVPTVYGARVWTREHIKHQDAYDDLAFAAGDGVCLASAAMLPPGYRVIKDGLVKSDRGHVGLLGDLEGMGQCLKALIRGRRQGVGWGSATPLAPAAVPDVKIRSQGQGNVSGTGAHGAVHHRRELDESTYEDPSSPAENNPTHVTGRLAKNELGHEHSLAIPA